MIGWIDHQRHLWSADETKLFIVTISKANQQLCDVTEAIWLAVSPNIAQNGLRTLSAPMLVTSGVQKLQGFFLHNLLIIFVVHTMTQLKKVTNVNMKIHHIQYNA